MNIITIKIGNVKKKNGKTPSLQLLTVPSVAVSPVLSWGTSEMVSAGSNCCWLLRLMMGNKGSVCQREEPPGSGCGMLAPAWKPPASLLQPQVEKLSHQLPTACAVGAMGDICSCYQTQALFWSFRLFFHPAFCSVSQSKWTHLSLPSFFWCSASDRDNKKGWQWEGKMRQRTWIISSRIYIVLFYWQIPSTQSTARPLSLLEGRGGGGSMCCNWGK